MSDIPTIDADTFKTLIREGVRPLFLICDGQPRDAFPLTVRVDAWNNGYVIKRNIPKGTMAAFTEAETINLDNLEELKSRLAALNCYPMGDTADDRDDFSLTSLEKVQKWFTDRHVVPPLYEFEDQLPHLRQIKISVMGQKRFDTLTHHLADNMAIFKRPDDEMRFIIQSREDRIAVARSILDGLANSKRYIRYEPGEKPFRAIMFDQEVKINGTSIVVGGDTRLYAVLRPDENITALRYDLLHSTTDLRYIVAPNNPSYVTGKVPVSALPTRPEHRPQSNPDDNRPR